jgi:DNA replication and repair protein RecF
LFLANLYTARFRNIAAADLKLNPGINLLCGANGAGKTAVLEAVFLLGRGRSFRSTQNLQLIQHGQSDLVVRGEAVGETARHVLARQKGLSGLNQARINGENASRQSRYAEILPLQTLLPGISDLVLDGPGIRREFMDWGLFHVEQNYLPAAKRFRRALSQRSAWLKENHDHRFQSDPWAMSLASSGVEIAQGRKRFVDELNVRLSGTLEALGVDFHCQLAYTGEDFAEDEAKALGVLEKSFDRDRRFGATQSGPHRSDMSVLVDGVSARTVVSRGQAKLIASALVLSYASVLTAKTGQRPVLLLDDLGAELDPYHRERFFHQLHQMNCQVIATTTEEPESLVGPAVFDAVDVFHVEQGVISQK